MKPNPIINTPAAPNKTDLKSIADLKDFEGKFYSEELDTAYNAKIVNGKLLFSHIRHGDIELTDAGKDKFSGRIGFPVEIEFLRAGNGLITVFNVSNFGAKNVKFDKVK